MSKRTYEEVFSDPFVALDVAIEIVAHDTADTYRHWQEAQEGDDREAEEEWHRKLIRLLNVREELYRGNKDVLRRVLEDALEKRQSEEEQEDTTK